MKNTIPSFRINQDRHEPSIIKQISFVGLFVVFVAGMPLVQTASAQCPFSSGSTGTNGVFDPSSGSVPSGTTTNGNTLTVPLPPDGIFNFTSINIETNWVVKFTKNTLNTPVWLLAQSNVTVSGTIDVSGGNGTSTTGGEGGPGGFDGGTTASGGSHGFGPGGGGYDIGGNAGHFNAALCCTGSGYRAGVAYGVIDDQPMVGGSGSGGKDSAGGAGGGGAILIASSGTITCEGTITADGGTGDAGKGSGGSIRLIANTIQGEGSIRAVGGDPNAGVGIIRLEACSSTRVTLTSPPGTFGSPGSVFPSTNPTIRVTSIAGTNTPSIPTGSLTVPDVILGTNAPNPAVISVAASNILPNTVFQVIITPSYGSNMLATNSLSGTYSFSTGSVSIATYPDRTWRVNALIDYIPRP